MTSSAGLKRQISILWKNCERTVIWTPNNSFHPFPLNFRGVYLRGVPLGKKWTQKWWNPKTFKSSPISGYCPSISASSFKASCACIKSVYAIYIGVYYFCVVTMEKVYTIAVSFGKNVHSRGLTPPKPKLLWSFLCEDQIIAKNCVENHCLRIRPML